MRYLGGHLGIAVSALLDGQLDAPSAERAWAHVQACDTCRCQVEREGWVKTRLAAMTDDDDAVPPPPQLLGSLYGLGSVAGPSHGRGALGPTGPSEAEAWAAVGEIERRGRVRRRTGLAVAGAGSVSVAVLGLATLTGNPLGLGGGTPNPPTSALTRAPATGIPAVVAPVARVHGRLPSGEGEVRATPSPTQHDGGLRP